MVAFGNPFSLLTGENTINAANRAATDQNAYIQQGAAQAAPQYTAGLNYINQLNNQAYPWWQQNLNTSVGGVNQFARATGAAGDAGTDQAVADFWKSPQVASQLKAGNAAELARQAATGGTGSGSEAYALHNLDLDIAGKGWQNYVSNLKDFLPYSTANTTGIGSQFSTQAGQGVGQYNTLGNLAYGSNVSQGTNLGNRDIQIGNAQNDAAKNVFGLGSGLFSLLGGVGGIGNLASGAASLFKS